MATLVPSDPITLLTTSIVVAVSIFLFIVVAITFQGVQTFFAGIWVFICTFFQGVSSVFTGIWLFIYNLFQGVYSFFAGICILIYGKVNAQRVSRVNAWYGFAILVGIAIKKDFVKSFDTLNNIFVVCALIHILIEIFMLGVPGKSSKKYIAIICALIHLIDCCSEFAESPVKEKLAIESQLITPVLTFGTCVVISENNEWFQSFFVKRTIKLAKSK